MLVIEAIKIKFKPRMDSPLGLIIKGLKPDFGRHLKHIGLTPSPPAGIVLK